MQILIINYEFPPIGGGAGNASSNIAKHLAKLGTDVLVLTTYLKGLSKNEQIDGYRVCRISGLRRRLERCSITEMVSFMISGILNVRKVMRDFHFRPDMAYSFFGIPSGPIALWLKALFGVPYIISARGGDVPGFLQEELGFYHKLSQPLIKLLWAQAAYIVTNSERLKELALQFGDISKIRLIPNGVDTARFIPDQTLKSDDITNILAVGRLTKQKGFEFLLESVAHLKQNGRDRFILNIVGDGPQNKELQKKVVHLGISDEVRFSGWVDRKEIISHYQSADIFVSPSLDEGMSNALLEAMACGLPLIASDIAGNRGLVTPGHNGFLVPVGDVEGLADALECLIKEKSLAEAMGRNSLAIAKSFSWERVAREYLSLGRSLLQKNQRLKKDL